MNLFSGLFFFLVLQINRDPDDLKTRVENVAECTLFAGHSHKMVFVRITLDPLKYPEHT